MSFAEFMAEGIAATRLRRRHVRQISERLGLDVAFYADFVDELDRREPDREQLLDGPLILQRLHTRHSNEVGGGVEAPP